ncbi:hypothetical protein D3C78_1447280 [compost metagenome]
MLAQAEVLGVIAKVLADLLVPRVVRHLGGHGEFIEGGSALGRDQVRRLVHRAVRVADIPQAADIAVQLEADEGNSMAL